MQLNSENVFMTYLFTVIILVEARTSQFAHQQLCNFQAIEALKRMGAQINPFNDNLPIKGLYNFGLFTSRHLQCPGIISLI